MEVHVLPKYPHITKHTHALTYYKTSLNNHSTEYTPNKIATLQSNTLSMWGGVNCLGSSDIYGGGILVCEYI